MSGHSKWSTIKRKKGAADAKRSKMFSKIVKEISIAVKEGGLDVESNPRLRLAIQNAKGANMPKSNVENAINKANKDPDSFEEVTFEGYANGGVAIFVECLSDNNNRTVSNIRAIFNKYNGSLGKHGSLSFLFDRKGIFTIPISDDIDPDEFELEIIDAGAEDIEKEDDVYIITTEMKDFGSMQNKLEELKINIESAKLERIPVTTKKVDANTALSVLRMVDVFDDDNDVQNVFHNLEMTDEIEKLLS